MDLLPVDPKRRRGIHTSKRGPSMGSQLREAVAPSMGYRAWGRWFMLKMLRQAQSPYKVSMGAALGMYVNFLPIPGFGALGAMLLAFLCRASLPVAFLAQIPSNPWTFGFIWALSYTVGKLIVPLPDGAISFGMLMQNFHWAFLIENFDALIQGVMIPLIVGGQVLGIPLAILTYYVMDKQVRLFWDKRRAKQAARLALKLKQAD